MPRFLNFSPRNVFPLQYLPKFTFKGPPRGGPSKSVKLNEGWKNETSPEQLARQKGRKGMVMERCVKADSLWRRGKRASSREVKSEEHPRQQAFNEVVTTSYQSIYHGRRKRKRREKKDKPLNKRKSFTIPKNNAQKKKKYSCPFMKIRRHSKQLTPSSRPCPSPTSSYQLHLSLFFFRLILRLH